MISDLGTCTVACPRVLLVGMIELKATGPSGFRNKTICYLPEPRR